MHASQLPTHMRPDCPRTCVPSTELQSLAGILQCTCPFSIRVSPFLVSLYPRPCGPSTTIQSLIGYPALHVSVFSSDITFSGPRLCVPSTKSQLPAGILRCKCLVTVQESPFLVPLYPCPCVPITTIKSLTGILRCTCLVSGRM